ncbi:cytochrome C peroxidase [Chitinophaga silvatica]|uniref:Cytochrome C peroxidase n=1 Tax=Chitinophaga silvatica TaxID=2282649 RepID=A0A3E1Y7P1_9BACT|nr:cytochrome c peroxidase [Chitinophaga silvatica]RFS20753.1 cytochrome C peroxidase [Chitinophaga silvatica]
MYLSKIKYLVWPLFAGLVIFSVWGFKQANNNRGFTQMVTVFKAGAADFSVASADLYQSISDLDSTKPASLEEAKKQLIKARFNYKRIEWFMDYFFFTSSQAYNRPAKAEVEEPFMEYQDARGMQQIAVLLFEEHPYRNKSELLAQADLIRSSAQDLPSLLYEFTATDEELMESIRLELVRLYTGGITGYDAQELKTGIKETATALEVIQQVLAPWTEQFPELNSLLKSAVAYLHANPDFEQFDRLTFLSDYGLPLQAAFGKMVKELNLNIHTRSKINYDAPHLFSKSFFQQEPFLGKNITNEAVLKLGQKLFYDANLSGNLQRSCATCHQPEKYFTDALPVSKSLDPRKPIRRNAPTLYYAGFQHAQFWDGRAGKLVQQIETVIRNPQEMNADPAIVLSRLEKQPDYVNAFKKAYADSSSPLSLNTMYDAIATYVASLAPMESAMDRYFEGNKTAMDAAQKRGFNLFTGKGLCATCHFAPLFNGLIPPFYELTEYEGLGMTATANLKKPIADKDAGRYGYFPMHFYTGAFKTPTVRNAAVTAPYMHNGAFNDLHQLMEFYNAGGGNGLGLNFPYQTLSATPLGLSENEMLDIIAFLGALTDSPPTK